ncbi:putative CRISPR-associated protein [Sulfolobus sp. E11-6]|nr:putative CRISPR-associated protein [Sulfolobus sp. E11-6]
MEGWEYLKFDDPKQDKITANSSELKSKLLLFINKKGNSASAEIQSIEQAVEKFGHKPDDTLIFLYSTNSANAQLAAETIQEYFNSKKYETQKIVVQSINSEDEFDKGLADLLDKVASKMIEWKNRGSDIYVNVTTGFKAESIFLALSAFMIGGKVYYRYETFNDIILLPSPPIIPDQNIVNKLSQILNSSTYIISKSNRYNLSDEDIENFTKNGILKEKDKDAYEIREWVKKFIDFANKIKKETH